MPYIICPNCGEDTYDEDDGCFNCGLDDPDYGIDTEPYYPEAGDPVIDFFEDYPI